MQQFLSLSRPRVLAACALIVFVTMGVASQASAATMVVTFAIRDYAAWRPVFDRAGIQRAKVGVTNARVYRNAEQPNNLLVLFDAADVAKGRAWMTSTAVKADWKAGGVVGEPSFHFFQ